MAVAEPFLRPGAILAIALLAGCNGPAEGAPQGDVVAVSAGLDAYQAGDETGLRRAIKALDAQHPPIKEKPERCSVEDYEARRTVAMRGLITRLDRPVLRALSEEARFVYLDDHARRLDETLESESPRPDPNCVQQPGGTVIRLQDGARRADGYRTVQQHVSAWRERLGVRPGLDARTAAARKLLEAQDLTGG